MLLANGSQLPLGSIPLHAALEPPLHAKTDPRRHGAIGERSNGQARDPNPCPPLPNGLKVLRKMKAVGAMNRGGVR